MFCFDILNVLVISIYINCKEELTTRIFLEIIAKNYLYFFFQENLEKLYKAKGGNQSGGSDAEKLQVRIQFKL